MSEWPDRHIIFGMPRSGKSTRAALLARQAPRVVYYDTQGHDYHDGLVCDGLDDLRSAWRGCYRNDRFRLIYRRRGSTAADRKGSGCIDPEFSVVCRMVRSCGGVLFVVEEVHTFVGRDGRYDDAFEDLILCGSGHYGVGLILVTQMPQDIGRALLAMPNRWNIFQTADSLHLRIFEKRCRGVAMMDIVTLAQYQYVEWMQDADRYWLCKDDPATGKTERTDREYTYASDGHGDTAADHRDVGTGDPLAHDTKDGTPGVQAAQDQTAPADGQSER